MIAYWRSGKSRSRPPSRVISASPDGGAGPGRHWNEYVEPRNTKMRDNTMCHLSRIVTRARSRPGAIFPRKLRTCPLRGIRGRNWTLCIDNRFDERTRRQAARAGTPAVAPGKASHRCRGVRVYPPFQGSSPPASCLGRSGARSHRVVGLSEQRPGGLQTGSNRPLRPAGPLSLSKSLRPAPGRGSSLSAAGCRTALGPIDGRADCSELARDLLVAGAGIRASKICARLSVRAAMFICLYPPTPGGSKTSVNPTRGLRLSYCSTVFTREPFC
jgi:hypothetical protein